MIPIESKTERLIAILLQEIGAGRYPEASRLPSERELAGRHAVSRITIRRALAELEARGILTRRQGKGTFVGKPAVGKARPVPSVATRAGFLFMPGRRTSALFEQVFHGFREFADAAVSSRVYLQGYLTPEAYRRDRLDVLIVDGAFDDAAVADLNRAGFKTIVLNRVTAAGAYL